VRELQPPPEFPVDRLGSLFIRPVRSFFDAIRKSNFDSSENEATNIHYVIIKGNYGEKQYGMVYHFNLLESLIIFQKNLKI